MSQRLEFVLLASQAGGNFRQLCRRFQISTKTGYKWCKRYEQGGVAALADQSRRPKRSPRRCKDRTAAQVVALYTETLWGGRKLHRRLRDLGHPAPPAPSTCTAILHRAGVLPADGPVAGPHRRFERSQSNELWQMDFKGHIPTQSGQRCHPLTVLDDHSRFSLVLEAQADETGASVQRSLRIAFATYGLPEMILCDNASPWGATDPVCPYTRFSVWLLQLGVRVIHGRPYHPQTQGKDERFHRTLTRELLSRHTWRDLAHCAALFPSYRHRYNCERPHDALGGDTPVQHYRPSPRSVPSALPALEYACDTIVRTVRSNGAITFANQTWYVGRAFVGLAIGLRPNPQADGQWQVWFAHHLIGRVDLRSSPQPKHSLRSIYQT